MTNKKQFIRVTAGKFRGKIIPFDNEKFGHADITPQRVKGAAFSSLGENMNGKVFLDLFSGSGQIGMEALIRGAELVIFNERDKKRFNFIKGELAKFQVNGKTLFLNNDYSVSLEHLKKKKIFPDIIYIDPPYVKKEGDDPGIYSKILSELAGVVKPTTVILLQHFTGNRIPEETESFRKVKSRKYGTTTLSIYEQASS